MIRTQGKVAVYGEVWFDEEPPAEAGVDILVHRYRSTPIPQVRTVTATTLRTDLARPMDEIMATFDATCRREIRRADSRDDLYYELIPEAVDRLEEFTTFYEEFARQKGLSLTDRHWLGRAATAHQLVLSHSYRHSEQLVWHAYVCIGATACLTHSASWLRARDSRYRSLVGRANRWLHWQDMLSFKRAGVRYYDWGGMFRDESTGDHAGINQFKRMFGGRPVRTYECTVPVSARGRIWLALRDAWRGWPFRRDLFCEISDEERARMAAVVPIDLRNVRHASDKGCDDLPKDQEPAGPAVAARAQQARKHSQVPWHPR